MKHLYISLILIFTSTMANATCSGLYNHQFTTLQGESFDLCEYQNKPILVVNTASKCGFTPQFEALEALYDKYKDQGLLVVGFPSNDFKQELTSNKAIGDFCKMTYSVSFPMMAKSTVSGIDANPLYKTLTHRTGQAPMWNFYKYLVMPKGEKVYVYSSDVKPSSDELLARIKSALK